LNAARKDSQTFKSDQPLKVFLESDCQAGGKAARIE